MVEDNAGFRQQSHPQFGWDRLSQVDRGMPTTWSVLGSRIERDSYVDVSNDNGDYANDVSTGLTLNSESYYQ